MNTFRYLVYLVLDELKILTDDSTFTEDHIISILNRYRTFLLKQRYSDIKKQIPQDNYQTICLTTEIIQAVSDIPCTNAMQYRKSIEVIPYLMTIGNIRLYIENYYNGEIAFVSKDRMRYVGYNKYIPNTIYASVSDDSYLYLKANNLTAANLDSIKLTGVFSDAVIASELVCNKECDILDRVFPLETALISPLIELTVKELSMNLYRPEDKKNDADDSLSNATTKAVSTKTDRKQ